MIYIAPLETMNNLITALSLKNPAPPGRLEEIGKAVVLDPLSVSPEVNFRDALWPCRCSSGASGANGRGGRKGKP